MRARRDVAADGLGEHGPQRLRAWSWPMSATAADSASPGTSSAVRSPPSGVISVSSRPWITSIGTSSAARPALRSPAGVDRGELPGRTLGVEAPVVLRGGDGLQPARGRSTSSTPRPRRSARRRCSRHDSAAAGRGAPRAPRGSAARRADRPGCSSPTMTLAIRSGCSIAIVCTIIPPIELPTMWARSIPRWSSRPMPSAAMSDSV